MLFASQVVYLYKIVHNNSVTLWYIRTIYIMVYYKITYYDTLQLYFHCFKITRERLY